MCSISWMRKKPIKNQPARVAFYWVLTHPKKSVTFLTRSHQICLKLHPEEDLGELSPKTLSRASNEARKASKNAFLNIANFFACGGLLNYIAQKNGSKPHQEHSPSPTPTNGRAVSKGNQSTYTRPPRAFSVSLDALLHRTFKTTPRRPITKCIPGHHRTKNTRPTKQPTGGNVIKRTFTNEIRISYFRLSDRKTRFDRKIVKKKWTVFFGCVRHQ
jgi:hypothetical protein